MKRRDGSGCRFGEPPVKRDGNDAAVIARAAETLAAGGLIAFPTETVYGLGARADDATAVTAIFRAKGRPENHPLIVHVAGEAQVDIFAADVPVIARRLIGAFWPGPLTVIVRRVSSVAAVAAGGQDSIGLRCPSHPVAQALLRSAWHLGVPGVAAPSANRFGRVSPTCADHVVDEFGDSFDVLDGGDSAGGIESTIVDCTRDRPVLLRPGVLARARIEAAAGEPLQAPDAAAPRASGTLSAHYATRAALRLMPAGVLRAALQMLGRPSFKLAVYSRGPPPAPVPGLYFRQMPVHPERVAHELFSVMRSFDAEGVQIIWVEELPAQPEWDGVRDRLTRAATAAGA